MSDRDEFFANNQPASEKVHVKKLGKTFTVIEMTGPQRAAWAAIAWDAKGNYIEEHDKGRLLAHTVYNGGSRVFTDDDYAAIEAGGGAAIHKLYIVALRLNGLSKDSLEEVVKN